MIDLKKNTAYDLNSERPKVDFAGDPGMTKQEPAEDADINILMRRFGVTDGSALPYFPQTNALYADLTLFPDDPTEIANIMRNADLEFMRIPADLRSRFRSAAGLHNFLMEPKNLDEAIRLGLLSREATQVSPSTGSVKEEPVPPVTGETK